MVRAGGAAGGRRLATFVFQSYRLLAGGARSAARRRVVWGCVGVKADGGVGGPRRWGARGAGGECRRCALKWRCIDCSIYPEPERRVLVVEDISMPHE